MTQQPTETGHEVAEVLPTQKVVAAAAGVAAALVLLGALAAMIGY